VRGVRARGPGPARAADPGRLRRRRAYFAPGLRAETRRRAGGDASPRPANGREAGRTRRRRFVTRRRAPRTPPPHPATVRSRLRRPPPHPAAPRQGPGGLGACVRAGGPAHGTERTPTETPQAIHPRDEGGWARRLRRGTSATPQGPDGRRPGRPEPPADRLVAAGPGR
jgi:hypothetical protein